MSLSEVGLLYLWIVVRISVASGADDLSAPVPVQHIFHEIVEIGRRVFYLIETFCC